MVDVQALYTEHSEGLSRFIASLVGDADAGDILHEVYLKLMTQTPPTLDNGPAWLYCVARNACMDHLKGQKCIADIEVDDLPDTRDLRDAIRAELLSAAMASLPEIERKVVERRYWDDMSIEDIATELGLSRGATVRVAKRAVDNMRAWYAAA